MLLRHFTNIVASLWLNILLHHGNKHKSRKNKILTLTWQIQHVSDARIQDECLLAINKHGVQFLHIVTHVNC